MFGLLPIYRLFILWLEKLDFDAILLGFFLLASVSLQTICRLKIKSRMEHCQLLRKAQFLIFSFILNFLRSIVVHRRITCVNGLYWIVLRTID